jgi:hypothetical protein
LRYACRQVIQDERRMRKYDSKSWLPLIGLLRSAGVPPTFSTASTLS